MTYDDFFAEALVRLWDERRYRVFAELERIAGRFPIAVRHSRQGPKEIVIWCSNDYLGMGQHPKVIGAMVETATRVGTGAGGTRNIGGNSSPLVELEREIADLHRKAAALVFTIPKPDALTGSTRCIKRMGLFRGDNVKMRYRRLDMECTRTKTEAAIAISRGRDE